MVACGVTHQCVTEVFSSTESACTIVHGAWVLLLPQLPSLFLLCFPVVSTFCDKQYQFSPVSRSTRSRARCPSSVGPAAGHPWGLSLYHPADFAGPGIKWYVYVHACLCMCTYVCTHAFVCTCVVYICMCVIKLVSLQLVRATYLHVFVHACVSLLKHMLMCE